LEGKVDNYVASFITPIKRSLRRTLQRPVTLLSSSLWNLWSLRTRRVHWVTKVTTNPQRTRSNPTHHSLLTTGTFNCSCQRFLRYLCSLS